MSIRQYLLLLALLLPVLLGYTLWQGWRAGCAGYLRGRLGGGTCGTGKVIWLHAASVGEVNAALPLLERLLTLGPLLVTTTTPSGAARARQLLGERVQHALLPLDYPFAVRRFLKCWQPRCALIMETELWPNLYRHCAQQAIPLLIINGRLSRRTLGAGAWLRALYRDTLQHTRIVLARSETDAKGFRELGAPHCEVIGNIKFAAAPSAAQLQPLSLPRPFVLAASTRDGEEALLLQAWQTLRDQDLALPLLVIAPRHPQRRETILRALSGETVALRSRGEPITPQTTIYLADTFGELANLMLTAELVFVGGSLVNKGGQNLLEPAALGKAILFGPHMENFRDEAETLLNAGAAIQVETPSALAEALAALLREPERSRQLGKNAQQEIEQRRDMADRYLVAIRRNV